MEFGGYRLAVPDDVFGVRPELTGYEGKEVVVGIRPEDMEDASLVPDAPADRRISSSVLTREALGADVRRALHDRSAARCMTEDAKELAHDVGRRGARGRRARSDRGRVRVPRPSEPADEGAEGRTARARRGRAGCTSSTRTPVRVSTAATESRTAPFVESYGWRGDRRRDTSTEGGEALCGSSGARAARGDRDDRRGLCGEAPSGGGGGGDQAENKGP